MKCSLCDAPSTLFINGTGYCVDHADAGFDVAVQIEAMEKGADFELSTRRAHELMREIIELREQDS